MSAPAARRLVVAPDAATRLAAAHAWLAALPADAEVLVLSAGWEGADDLVRTALGPDGARFGVLRLTLDRLAARLAAPTLARAGRAPTTSLSHVAVVARAVHRLHGRFGHFAPVADRPGFPPAVARTLEELRLQRVTPAAVARVGRGGKDLAALADAVDAALVEAGLADRAARFEAALAAAAVEPPPAPLGLPLLCLDLPVRSALEAALVAAAARGVPVLATAPAGDDATVARLAAALDVAPDVRVTGTPDGSLAALQTHLFARTAPERRPLDDGVSLAAWPGEARECMEIARAIRREAAQGTPFDRMAVLVHAPAEYVAHLEEALSRADVPYVLARGTQRPHPAGRALLTLLACAAEGCSARRFAEYLSLGQVPDPGSAAPAFVAPESDLLPPEEPAPVADDDPLLRDPDAAPVVAGTLRAPRHWERLLVDAAVIGGTARWATRLDGLRAELVEKRAACDADDEARAALLDRQLRDLGHLRGFALPLVTRLAALPREATWETWLAALQALATAALRQPEPVLATLAELAPMGPVGPVGLDEVRLVLAARLRELAVPPPRRRYGAVLVAPPHAVRGLAFDVVFVPGLAEHLFPGKVSEDPVLLDAERDALGPGVLATDADRAAEERLALRLAVGAARRRVVLSWPRVDVERARPRVPSFYALEALRAAEGWLPGFDELARRGEAGGQARLGWPAPQRPEDAVDEAEYDLALLAPLLDAPEDQVVGTASYLLGANPHLARALRARARRWFPRWSAVDGLVDPDALALEALARHQLSARSYSPTALQHFAACPYRFFLQAIHRLQPREDPEPVEAMDPLVRGSLFHDVQFEVLTALKARTLLPLHPDALPEAEALLEQRLNDEAAKQQEKLAPAITRVWDDGVDQVRADLREWLRRLTEEAEGWVPDRFELAFGLPRGERLRADPKSVGTPVPLVEGLQLRGSIDLVERHPRGGLRATDHKTGKVYADDGVVVGGGQILQPLLYALALERLLDAPVEAGRLYYCTSTGDWTERVVPLDDATRARIAEVVRIIGNALRRGFFPAAPEERTTCQWCDYRPVCGPWEWIRVARKPQDRLVALQRLREMP